MRRCPRLEAPAAMRVLVVDDCRDSVLTLSRLLGLAGHDIEAARTGAEAINLASVFQPQAVILDPWMPRMDGYAVAKRLRQTEGLEGVRIVALSGASPDDARLKEAGIDAQLLKPATLEQMLEAMSGGKPTEPKHH
jgi:CheY-like chemotaxis protein